MPVVISHSIHSLTFLQHFKLYLQLNIEIIENATGIWYLWYLFKLRHVDTVEEVEWFEHLNINCTARPVTVAESQSRHVNLRIPVVFSGLCILANLQRAQSADPRQIDRSTDPAPSGSIAAADPSSTWAPVWWYPYYPCSYPWIFGQMWELWDSMMMKIFDMSPASSTVTRFPRCCW